MGQLLRERHGRGVVSIGFTTCDGAVTAASDWDGPAEYKQVRPALAGSYEALFHDAALSRVYLRLGSERLASLREPRLERAIGVIDMPDTHGQEIAMKNTRRTLTVAALVVVGGVLSVAARRAESRRREDRSLRPYRT